MNTPLLLLTWRRPDTLRKVINAIRPVGPSRLYIACDGPSPDRIGEYEKVLYTRHVIDTEIDWPCHIERLYSDVNQGCRLGVSRAITWFFGQVDEGIVLEDDCIPHPDFFYYCSSLLEYYRNDMRVWCISGNNFQDSDWEGCGDYFFSQIPMCWGWATWRSRWKYYDSDLSFWPFIRDNNLLNSIIADPVMRSYWYKIWQELWLFGKPDSWAYRWAFSCVISRGLTAIPMSNLVLNVGFDIDATHTVGRPILRPSNGLPSQPLSHPFFLFSLLSNDLSIFNNHFGGKWRRFPLSLLRYVKLIIWRLSIFPSILFTLIIPFAARFIQII